MVLSIKRNPNVASSLSDSDKVEIFDVSTGLQSTCTMSTLANYISIGQSSSLTLINETAGDGDGDRETSVIFKGTQSGGEETTLAKLQASHDGASDDQKGDFIIHTNDGTDGDSPTERLRIDSNGLATFANNASVTGSLGIGEAAPATAVEITGTAPYITLHNSTEEDGEGGRESRLLFKGEQSGGEETTLAKIQASHDGTGDDERGDLIFYTNSGAQGDSPTERLRLDGFGRAVFSGRVNASAGGLQVETAVTDTANPPTQAEMVTAFGSAVNAGTGFIGYLNDAGGGTNTYLVMCDGTNYFYQLLTVGA